MSEKNMQNSAFDIYTLKANINKLRRDNNLGVKEFGEKFGIEESNASKYLSSKCANCFTIDQVVNIAKYFHVSTDELLGVQPTKKQDSEINLSDVFQTIFQLADMTDIELKDQSPSPVESSKIYIDIHFENQTINGYLKEWKELKTSNINANTKEHILDVWKKDLIEKGKSCTKDNDFSEDIE